MSAPVRPLAWLCLVGVPSACAPHPPGMQELQSRCERDASAWFQALHPGGVTQETVDHGIHTQQYTYSAHYNVSLKHCLVIASDEISTVYSDKPSSGVHAKSIVDLQTKAPVGEILVPWPAADAALRICSVKSKPCASMGEWEELAAPYMDR